MSCTCTAYILECVRVGDSFLVVANNNTATPAKEKSKAICIIADDDLFIFRSDLHLA